MRQLVIFAVTSAKEQGKVPWFVETLVSEVMEEMSEVDPDEATMYLLYTSQIMKWAATGELEDLPEALRAEVPALPSSEIVAHQ